MKQTKHLNAKIIATPSIFIFLNNIDNGKKTATKNNAYNIASPVIYQTTGASAIMFAFELVTNANISNDKSKNILDHEYFEDTNLAIFRTIVSNIS